MKFRHHLWLLIAFAVAAVGVWVLPGLLVGEVYDVQPLLMVKNFAATAKFSITDEIGRFLAPAAISEIGIISTYDGRLSVILLNLFAGLIPFSNLICWMILGAAILATSLIFWWLFVHKVYGAKVAWVSTVWLAFMPFFWRQAVWLDLYNFAFLFLFLSFALYVYLRERSEVWALLLTGLSFGAAAACKDAFLIFVPWLMACYLYLGRKTLTQTLTRIGIFLVAVLAVYLLPYIGDILSLGYPVNHNLARLWPGDQVLENGFYLHLYPDPYTYFFAREAFDAAIFENYQNLDLLGQASQIRPIMFDIVSASLMVHLVIGFKLLISAIPSLFQQVTLGGLVLWIFIIPGLIFIWRTSKAWLIMLLGLIVSSELIMRFWFHYTRDHFMDYGFIFALLAAVGLWHVIQNVSVRKITCGVVITILVAAHLVQINRTLFAERYRRSSVPYMRELAAAVNTVPAEAVIATDIGANRVGHVTLLSDRTLVPFASETVLGLYDKGGLTEALKQYEVTHVLGYSEVPDRVWRAIPAVKKIEVEEIEPPKPSAFISWLLHLVR